MDEQKKATQELPDEQMKDVTGGAFTGGRGFCLGGDTFGVKWRCTNPAQTAQYQSVHFGTEGGNPAQRCPYSTTPNKWCNYNDVMTCVTYTCDFLQITDD